MVHYFDKHIKEANEFVKELSNELGHPEEQTQTIRLLRSVLHTVRDRITISESLDLLSQLPMMLKSLYVEQWKFTQKPPLNYDDMAGMAEAVEKEQKLMGEKSFDWQESTEELVKIVLTSLRKYVTDGQAIHVMDQMPKEIKAIF